MKNWAIGWACNLNDLFVRFPYEKYKTFRNWTKVKKLQLVKRVFTESVKIIMNDIIENNVSFRLPSLGYRGGEIHMEGVRDSEFERARKNGKFKNVDFVYPQAEDKVLDRISFKAVAGETSRFSS